MAHRNEQAMTARLNMLTTSLIAAAPWGSLPETEQAAVVAHVEALAVMTPAKRAALLTLACT